MSGNLVSLSGEITPEGHLLTQRVYYEDTDFSGFVYHARYLHFLERGRTDFLRCMGVQQGAMAGDGSQDGLVFVVHRMELDFTASARMDDVLSIATVTEKVAGARMLLRQEIRRDGQLLIAALVTVAIVSKAGRPRRLPPALAESLGRIVRHD